ncbi:Uncharacterised protein [Porphyromonas crevioricanis]|uniref:Uncharacterized protein n=1 Tax=Porphyromonas crevioricanis TaxID=393921 RepID=A0A2X4PLP3_9PORP|nr:hypothetical protein PORCAN_1765 [Porphyromonas crevioricanis JCM 13913]SQH73720.1 Uncharacterised protein [Porphyromonas crevioricanis]
MMASGVLNPRLSIAHRWKVYFPQLESLFSSFGKFVFLGWKIATLQRETFARYAY